MRGFSKAIITGNLTRDPELRTTPNGATVCGFSVAVNRVYRDANGEQRETVSFIDCSAWGRLGETIAQYAKKGSGVLVSGRLDQRTWEDKVDHKKRSRVEIVVEDFNFVGAPSSSSNSYNGYGNYGSYGTPAVPVNSVSPVAPASTTSDIAPESMPDMPPADPEGEIDLSEIPF